MLGLVRRLTLSLAMLTFAAVAASGVTTARAEDGVSSSEITIGAIGALTGPLSFIGTPGRDSLTLGINEINDEGRRLRSQARLQFEHASSPAESIAAVKKLVEGDKVFILVLASGSTGAAAAADYVRQVGVPTYNLYGSTPIIRTPFSPERVPWRHRAGRSQRRRPGDAAVRRQTTSPPRSASLPEPTPSRRRP